MTSSKNTKRALLASVLSVVLCAAMLVGSTFAWFTDSVTSTGNIIKSGTLEVTMKWAKGTEDPASATWEDASEGAIFLWEPGYTEVRHVRISNVGSLALKYEVRIAATGEVSELADVIDVYYIEGGAQITDRTQLNDSNKIGTLAQVLAKSYAAKGNLSGKKGETVDYDIATIALKMQEGAGNEYQGKSIGSEFAIQLVATQDTYEEDAFDDQYDKDADYAYTVKTTNELLSAMESANTGEKVLVTSGEYTIPENVNTDAILIVGANDTVTLNLNGKTIAANHSATHNHNTLQNFGNLIIKNGTIANNDTDTGFGNAAIIQAGGTLELESCEITNKAGIAGSYCVGVIGGTAEIKNCTINGDRGGLSVEDDASVTVTNCKISAAYYYPLYIYGNGTSTFSRTTFVKVPKLATQTGNGGNYLIYNDFCPTQYGDKGTATFTGCQFISTRDTGSVFEVRTDKEDPAFTSLSFENCSYKNVTNVPEGFTAIE